MRVSSENSDAEPEMFDPENSRWFARVSWGFTRAAWNIVSNSSATFQRQKGGKKNRMARVKGMGNRIPRDTSAISNKNLVCSRGKGR